MARMAPAAVAKYEAEILSFIAARLDAMGEEASGLYNYYAYRVQIGEAQMDYERFFLDHLANERRLFHAGIGIGTLTIALANSGVECVGFEIDEKRYAAALAAREALLVPGARYEVRKANFPVGLKPGDQTREAALLFTNVGSGWDQAQIDAVIQSMHWFAAVYLDVRLFGQVLDTAGEQDALIARIREAGFDVEEVDTGSDLARYIRTVSRTPRPPEIIAPKPRRRKPLWKRIRRWVILRRRAWRGEPG